jgi:hypothetical protein
MISYRYAPLVFLFHLFCYCYHTVSAMRLLAALAAILW